MLQDKGTAAGASGVVVTFLTWLVAHIELINGVLQTLVLVAGLVSSFFAARYYHRRTPKK